MTTTDELKEHQCDGGWEDRDADPPRPCPICRPWHYACATCGATARACANTIGKCCPSCPHTPPSLAPPKPQRRRRRTHWASRTGSKHS